MDELRSTSQSPFSRQHIWNPMDAQVAAVFPTSRTSNAPPLKFGTTSKRPRSSVGWDHLHWADSTAKISTNNRTHHKSEAYTQVNRPKCIFGRSSDNKASSSQVNRFSLSIKASRPSSHGSVHSTAQRRDDTHPKGSSNSLASRALVDVTRQAQSSTIYMTTPKKSTSWSTRNTRLPRAPTRHF